MSTRRKNLLIIDLDGTLVDSRRDITEALNVTRRRFSLAPYPEEEVARHVGHGVLPLLFSGVDETMKQEVNDVFAEWYLQHIAVHTSLYPGWADFLQDDPSLQKVILTNKAQRFADRLVDELGIRKYFMAVFGRESFSPPKPSATPVRGISAQFTVPVAELVLVGDTDVDIRTSVEAGADSIAVTWGYMSPSELAALGPTFMIDNPRELIPLIYPER